MARTALAIFVVLLPSVADADCRQFFVAHKQVAYVAPVVYPQVVYQVGRDIEADALAAKALKAAIPQIVAEVRAQLNAPGAAPSRQAIQAPRTSVLAQHCAKCHSGANPKAGMVFDGVTAVGGDPGMDALREISEGRMPKDHKLSPDLFAPIMQELLDLHKAGKITPEDSLR